MSTSDHESDPSLFRAGSECDSEAVDHLDKTNVEKLISLRENINWEIEADRHTFLDQLCLLIKNWKGQLPDLSEIFRPEEIDWLLVQDAYNKTYLGEVPLIDFVIRTGYKDKPDLDKDGKPILRRTTAVHRAARSSRSTMCISISKLFQIYKDVNFIDESGLTHFHIACKYGYKDVVNKFLELGQDPDCLAQKSVDPPLHLALKHYHKDVVELLLRGGADANLANKDGLTPLHVISKVGHCYYCELVELFFKINEELKKPVKVNAQDKLGFTPLHFALRHYRLSVAEFLLKKGADPNLTSNDGSTALHVICKIQNDGDLATILFNTGAGEIQKVKVDAADKLGRTPLQWAVANLLCDVVDVVLDHGADLSSFVFPTEDYFAVRYKLDCTLQKVVFRTISIIESLESKGYELDQTAALMIMKLFAKYGLIDDSVNVDECLRKDKEFMSIAKEQMVSSSLTLYDFLRLPHEEAENVLKFENYQEFTCEISHLSDESHRVYIKHLCETVARRFFRRWALELFSKKSPWLSKNHCKKIINSMNIKDLWDICMAAANENTQWLDSVRTDYVKKYYSREVDLSFFLDDWTYHK
ncbi:ankyrin-1-like [Trichogramma pretiosum]|uniref:ankyrin-1-like n=1 Tax=Trichogramma pretiosum TaxID=7493 RepID=UPI000C71C9AA|nr:ankyrin-1-like [Trichogramma pretiosum]